MKADVAIACDFLCVLDDELFLVLCKDSRRLFGNTRALFGKDWIGWLDAVLAALDEARSN